MNALPTLRSSPPPRPRSIGAERLAAAQRLAGPPILVDVRSPDAFFGSALGHIPGSLLVPLEHLLAESATLAAIGRPLVLVCEDGARAAEGARLLALAGLDDVSVLEGGIHAWRAHGLAVDLDA